MGSQGKTRMAYTQYISVDGSLDAYRGIDSVSKYIKGMILKIIYKTI